jgi:hypothetical protein
MVGNQYGIASRKVSRKCNAKSSSDFRKLDEIVDRKNILMLRFRWKLLLLKSRIAWRILLVLSPVHMIDSIPLFYEVRVGNRAKSKSGSRAVAPGSLAIESTSHFFIHP